MTAPTVALPLSAAIPGAVKKKRVLLVDSSARIELRAEIMRRLGIEVDCAADVSQARSWWRADLYNLVLIDLENGAGHLDGFLRDIRSATPPQQLSFLVGKPEYLADAPNMEDASSGQRGSDPVLQKKTVETGLADVSGTKPQRWGILEASQRISAVRSASHARSQAIQGRPAPSRDLEPRYAKRPAAETRTLNELLGEMK